jgi:glycosyltransferase 2 family protein
MGAYAAMAAAWCCLLLALGLRPTWRCAVGVYFSTQIAKYLPGNIGQHVGRVYLSATYGLPAFGVGLSIAVEIALIISVAALLSLPLAPLLLTTIDSGIGLAASTVVLLLGLAGVAAVMVYLLRRNAFIRSGRNHLAMAFAEARAHGSLRYLPPAIALIVFSLVLVGISLLMLDIDAVSIDVDTLITAVALVSASWVAGFLTPGAPAGLGVREALLLAGLGPIVGRHAAFEVTIMFRGVSIASDLLAFAIGTLLLRTLQGDRKQRVTD